VPVIAWCISDDTQRSVENSHFAFEIFDDDSFPACLSDNEVDRSREAQRRLDDGHNANLSQAVADFFHIRKIR